MKWGVSQIIATMKQQTQDQPGKPPKIQIVEYHHDLLRDDCITAYTANGGRIILFTAEVDPKYHTYRRLYVDSRRHFFHLTKNKLRQVWENYPPTMKTHGRKCHNGKRGNLYPIMRHFGSIQCHIFVCTAFHGPRPVFPDGKRAECDHKNGNPLDFTPENLEWVHPDENRWRSTHVLQVLRKHDIYPVDYSGSDMDIWFRIMSKYDRICPDHSEKFTKQDYLHRFHNEKLAKRIFG